MKGTAGFIVPLKNEGYGENKKFMRIPSFFDYELSNYDFYHSFDRHLVNYKGNPKTKGTAMRVSITFAFLKEQ